MPQLYCYFCIFHIFIFVEYFNFNVCQTIKYSAITVTIRQIALKFCLNICANGVN